jgi:hypothetical protein
MHRLSQLAHAALRGSFVTRSSGQLLPQRRLRVGRSAPLARRRLSRLDFRR